MSNPLISVIIPTFNRLDDLRKCLQALLNQIDEIEDCEILVLDDAKNSRIKRSLAIEFPTVIWNEGPHRGPASNRNAGAKEARGEWLIFIDDDCVPRPNLITAYRKHILQLKKDDAVALEGPTFRTHEPNSLLWEAPHTPDGGALISCNFAISHALFWRVGGFDERFPMAYFEDTEFAARAQQMGVAVLFVPEAAVDHPLRPLPKAKKLANRWEARVIASYDMGAKPWQVLWYLNRHVILVIARRFIGHKLTWSNIEAIGVFASEYWFFLQKLPFWCRRHRRSRSMFWSHPSQASSLPPRFGL